MASRGPSLGPANRLTWSMVKWRDGHQIKTDLIDQSDQVSVKKSDFIPVRMNQIKSIQIDQIQINSKENPIHEKKTPLQFQSSGHNGRKTDAQIGSENGIKIKCRKDLPLASPRRALMRARI